MNNNCQHPVKHEGTAQTDRLLKALIPSNLRLDPRDEEDLMVFAARFAKTLQYWKVQNKGLISDGDWSDFWECDYLFFLALVAALDVEGLEKQFKKNVLQALNDTQLSASEEDCDPNPCNDHLRTLINGIYHLAATLNEWGEKAKIFPDLAKDFVAVLQADLAEYLPTLIKYDKGCPPTVNDYDPFILDCNPPEAFAANWHLSKKNYIALHFLDPCLEPYHSIQTLQKLATAFISALLRLRDRAKHYLSQAQSGANRQHQPHIALFFAFLHLFRHLQNQLNGLTQQHLDHYYQRILHLERRKQMPDRAHLVFQLAQGALRHTLEPGTTFRAGKDQNGTDLFYHLERPLSLNKAQVAEIRTLYKTTDSKTTLYEDTILDTDKKSPAPQKISEVLPFYPLGKAEQGALSPIGFAIGSAELLTSKANRRLEVKVGIDIGTMKLDSIADNKDFWKLLSDNKEDFTTKSEDEDAISGKSEKDKFWNDHIQPNLAKLFIVEISTTEGWLKIHDSVASVAKKTKIEANTLSKSVGFNQGSDNSTSGNLTLCIGKSHPATAAPTKAIHGDLAPDSDWPVLKVSLDTEFLTEPYYKIFYPFLSSITVNKITIDTDVKDVTDFKLIDGNTHRQLPDTRNLDINQLAGGGVFLYSDEVFNRNLIAIVDLNIEPSLTGIIKSEKFYIDGNQYIPSENMSEIFEKPFRDPTNSKTFRFHFARSPKHNNSSRYLWIDFTQVNPNQDTRVIPPRFADLTLN